MDDSETKKQSPLAIIAMCIGAVLFTILLNVVDTPNEKNEKQEAFSVFIKKAKKLCSGTSCIQEITATNNKGEYSLVLKKEPWLSKGQTVKIKRVYLDRLIVPSKHGTSSNKHKYILVNENS